MGEVTNQLYRNIDDNAQPREEIVEVGALWSTAPTDQTDPDLVIPQW